VFAAEMPVNSVILYPLYALAIGVAAASAQRGLVTGAMTADAMAEASMVREAQARIIENSEQLVTQIQRKVHETVLNTLTAISRGNLLNTEAVKKLITERSSESAKVLGDLADLEPLSFELQGNSLVDSISDLIEEFGSRGVSLSIDGDWGDRLPKRVEDALVAAVREALMNSLRHSEASAVTVNVTRSNLSHYRVTVKDNGNGFEPGGRSGFGLGTVLKTDLEAVGASANIESRLRNGCIVKIDYWPHQRKFLSVKHQPDIPMSNLVVPVITAWMLFSVVNILLAWDGYSNVYLNVLAFLILSTIGISTIYLSFSGTIPWWLVLTGSVGAYLAYKIEQRAIDVGNINQWTEWSSEFIVAVFFVFAVAGTWWSWIIVAIVWLIMQDNWPAEFIAAGFVMIMTGAYLGWVLRRNNRVIRMAMDEAATQTTQAFMSQLQVNARFPGLLHVNPNSTIQLLQGVSSGTLDWESEEVQHLSAVHEAFIRNVVMSRNASASKIIGKVSEYARDRGVIFESSVSESLLIDGCVHHAIRVASVLINIVDPGKVVRFTVTGDSEKTHFQLVGAVCRSVNLRTFSPPDFGEFECETEPDGFESFVWQAQCNSHLETSTRLSNQI
jgi:two-component sensor histidine kinase